MKTINLKELRNALSCWQDDYDCDDDKEQYDMFGAAIDAVSRLEAAEMEIEGLKRFQELNLKIKQAMHERFTRAERERDELRDKFDKLASAAGWSKEKCEQVGESPFDTVEGLKNAVIDHHHSLIKAEKELKRRDAAAGEVIYQFDCGEGWQDVDKTDYERYINSRGISTRKLYTAAQPAALPPKYDDELTVRAELIEAYSKTQCEIAQELGCDSDNESILKAICEIKELGAQQQKVVELPEPVKWPEVPFKYFSEEQVFSMLDAAGVKWEVKK